MTEKVELRLMALDAEDLAILSSHLEGARLRVGDIAYLNRDKRFALVASRVPAAWVLSEAPERGEACGERRLTGVHFERVLKVSTRGIDRSKPETPLEIVALDFTPGVAPAGQITLLLCHDRDIRLEVECVEAACRDLGPETQDMGEGQGAGKRTA